MTPGRFLLCTTAIAILAACIGYYSQPSPESHATEKAASLGLVGCRLVDTAAAGYWISCGPMCARSVSLYRYQCLKGTFTVAYPIP
jgi:hypothetical protein